MDRKTRSAVVASTPFRRPKSNLEFEDIGISPIDVQQVATRSGVVKRSAKAPAPIRKPLLRKCAQIKDKVPASRAVLKELGISKEPNILSVSKSAFHLYPEPILLDSDEEADTPSSNIPQPVRKKNSMPSKSSLPKPLVTKTVAAKRKTVASTVDRSKIKAPTQDKVKEAVSQSTNQNTPQPTKKFKASNKNVKSAKVKDSNSMLDSVDSMFPMNYSSTRKNNVILISSLQNIAEEVGITWTPRSKAKRLAAINEEKTENDAVDSDNDNSKTLGKDEAACLERGDSIQPIQKENTTLVNENNVRPKNNFTKDFFSPFEKVVFGASKNSKGYVVARSLCTGSHDFGYLELSVDKRFSGQLKNMTYVLLEGKVTAFYAGMTQNMCAGDIFHISEDSGYQFQNAGSSHARLLYVKQKNL